MKSMMKVTAIILLLVLTAGCGMQGSPLKKQTGQQANWSENSIEIDTELAQRAKETAGAIKGVKESIAVAVNRDVTIGVKVSGFDRLRLKAIKNEAHNKIKELNQDYNVHVTTDKKHFVQLKQIESRLSGAQEEAMTDVKSMFAKIIREIDS